MTDSKDKSKNMQGIIILVVIVIAAVGGYSVLGGKSTTSAPEAMEVSAGEEVVVTEAVALEASAGEAADETVGMDVAPGNPVVAKVGDKSITRVDVFNFIQQLPPNARQMPLEELFPLAQNQLINANVMNAHVDGASLENDAEVLAQVALAKEQIVRNVYIQNAINAALTEDRVKQAYGEYAKAFPDVREVKASHILVKEEALAKSLIARLDGGEDFVSLAKESSTDATSQTGGDLGYFLQEEVVPAFGAAAFALKAGEYTKEPVKSQFGYHIIKSEDSRKRAVPALEETRSFLESQLRRVLLEEIVAGWRDETVVERFDINGNAIEPSAGE